MHGIAEANDKNMDDLVVKTINEKLDANITKKKRLMGLTELVAKKMDIDQE